MYSALPDVNASLVNCFAYIAALEKFSESARQIALGRFDVKLPNVHSNDEIKDLHDSLSYMQHSLSAYVTELQATTASKERIESELSIAREIQMGMIPKIFPPYPDRNDVDLHAILHPAKEVGGDLYDFYINDNRLYFVIGQRNSGFFVYGDYPQPVPYLVSAGCFTGQNCHRNE